MGMASATRAPPPPKPPALRSGGYSSIRRVYPPTPKSQPYYSANPVDNGVSPEAAVLAGYAVASAFSDYSSSDSCASSSSYDSGGSSGGFSGGGGE